MRATALERLLVVDRERRRSLASSAVLQEHANVDPAAAPFVVSSSKGFVQTRLRPDGSVWAGFLDCPLEEESQLLRRLYDALWRFSIENDWGNRCTSIADAVELATLLGFAPFGIVVPLSFLREAVGQALTFEEAEQLMRFQGYVAKVGDAFAFVGDLPEGTALVTTKPQALGTYARTEDAVAVMLFGADRNLILVGPSVA